MLSSYESRAIGFPAWTPECGDTERRSLLKINGLQNQMLATLAELAKPGGAEIALTNYIFGISYTIPPGADLLDVSIYNPNDIDQWVFIMITPAGPQPGMRPTFPIRAYAHNHAYYEAYTSGLSIPSGQVFSLAVSSAESTLSSGSPIYMAIRHS
jgi:hypothetical protein